MKIHRNLLLSLCLPGAVALAQSHVPAPATAPVSDALLQSVRSAPDPSSTIEAYSRALAAGRDNVAALKKAFVVRMVDLGAPELADAQAHDLIKRGAADALIAGTAAYNDAARGNAHAAIENLKLALTYSPRDSFLLRTAGQSVAWYDSQAGQSGLSREDAAGIEWLRAAGNGSQEFTETYQLAMQARRAQAARTTGEQSLPDQSTGSPATANPTTTAGGASQTDQRSSSDQRSSTERSAESSPSYSYYYYPSSSSGSNYSASYYPYAVYGYYGSTSIIAVRDGAFNRDVAALERSGADAILRGAGGDLRNIGGLSGNLNNLPGRGLPDNAARALSMPGQAASPGNGGPGGPPSMAGRPPQAPMGRPQMPSPPRPPTPPGPPHP